MNEAAGCQSVFKNGKTETTAQEITRVWIALINQIERSKAILAGL